MFHGNIRCPPDERGAHLEIQLLWRKWSSHFVRTLSSAVEKCSRRSGVALLGFGYCDWHHLQNMWTFSSVVVLRVNLSSFMFSDMDRASRTKQSLRRAKKVTLQDWHKDSYPECQGWTFLPHPTLLCVQSWWLGNWKDKMVSLERRRGELVVSVAAWKAGSDVSMIFETAKPWKALKLDESPEAVRTWFALRHWSGTCTSWKSKKSDCTGYLVVEFPLFQGVTGYKVMVVASWYPYWPCTWSSLCDRWLWVLFKLAVIVFHVLLL